MGFNNEIQPSRPNITEILTKMRASEYFVDRSFQRRLVWTDRQKVRLIETVLMEYPMPEIYLWEQVPDADTGLQKFSIVDGQQRLSTLREFTSNEWPLKAAFLDPDHQKAVYADKFWKDLSGDQRAAFFQYNINARRVPSAVSEDEIRTIFARLNETDRSLNPQEMRNATLNGLFLTASLDIADSEEMKGLDIFTKDNVRRMADVEFSSQLLGYERKGIVNDTPTSMNELYDEFSNEYPDSEKDVKKVKSSLKVISQIFEDALAKSFFETQNYVYTLYTLLDAKPGNSAGAWRKPLADFAAAYKAAPADDEPNAEVDDNISEFRKGASSRTRSKSSRTQRLFGLKKWIEVNYPDLS
ncbi:DUF262 domain-containing protein [Sulfitobacter sp. NAS-14.1]|uniref:DUF262 domain-containing protein n=1 Tax=Sulfitobacter TaxID=60136 RepID=UPI000066A4DE|nr:DUF262 domain-containing protein [Sulfitobacter sp. NAS-14.1]EAP81673.1 hypothetical protein NAS141_08046 [Sulfitobacter sp. NAS-14.1]